jgi:PAS domain S-box-containing protein
MTLSPDKVKQRTLQESRQVVTSALLDIRRSAATVADTLNSHLLHNTKVLRTVATMLEDGLVLLDKDSRITIFNPAASSIFGVQPTEAIGKSFDQLFPGLARRLQESTDAIADLHTVDEKGRQGVVNLSFSRLVSPEEGTPFSVLIASKSQGEASEKRAPELDAMYQALFWSMPMPALFTDRQGHIISGSQDFYQLLGRTPQQVTGRSVEELFPADAISWFYGDRARSSITINMSTPQGVQEFIAHKSPVESSDGTQLFGFITVLVRQQAAFGLDNEVVSTFIKSIDSLKTPIMLVSFSEGRILLTNKAFTDVFHYERKDVLNKNVSDFSVDNSVASAKRKMLSGLLAGEEVLQTVRIRDALGNRKRVTVKAVGFKTDNNVTAHPKYVLLTEV